MKKLFLGAVVAVFFTVGCASSQKTDECAGVSPHYGANKCIDANKSAQTEDWSDAESPELKEEPAQQITYVEPAQPVAAPVKKFQMGPGYYNENITEPGPNLRAYLDKKVKEIKAVGYDAVLVTGHADKAEKNPQALSEQRAADIAKRIAALGIPSDKIFFKGEGTKYPAATPKLTRRVEVTIE